MAVPPAVVKDVNDILDSNQPIKSKAPKGDPETGSQQLVAKAAFVAKPSSLPSSKPSRNNVELP